MLGRNAPAPLDRHEPLIKIGDIGNNVEIWSPVPQHLKLFLTLENRIFRFRAEDSTFAKNLIRGILNADYVLTSRCFDEAFGANPEIIGRGN